MLDKLQVKVQPDNIEAKRTASNSAPKYDIAITDSHMNHTIFFNEQLNNSLNVFYIQMKSSKLHLKWKGFCELHHQVGGHRIPTNSKRFGAGSTESNQ